MAHLPINRDNDCVNIYVPGQLFVFGSMTFYADSASHLASMENYAPSRIVTFGGLEYTTDARGKLILTSWTPIQAAETPDDGLILTSWTPSMQWRLPMTEPQLRDRTPFITPGRGLWRCRKSPTLRPRVISPRPLPQMGILPLSLKLCQIQNQPQHWT